VPPGPENDIPNWMTMTVELGIGIFIAALVFILQGKTSCIITQTIEKIDQYNEEQKKLQRSITHASLERIEYYLSAAWNSIGIDKDQMANMVETQRLIFVDNLLRRNHTQSVFKMLDRVDDQLHKESCFVRQYTVPELEVLLRSIIEEIRMLYGLSSDLPLIAGQSKVEKWNALCDMTLSQIERAQKLIGEARQPTTEN